MPKKRWSRSVAVIGLLLSGTTGAVTAAELQLVLDPERTEITFELGATLHTVHGTARLAEGRVAFDPAGGPASGRIVAAATSADTEHEKRDRDMHAKVLESEKFPEIEFRPSAVLGEVALEGESRVEIDGTFSIHGEDHPLTVEALVEVAGDELEATLEFEVPYVAWGMKNPSKLLLKVAREVQVRVRGFGRLEAVEGVVASSE